MAELANEGVGPDRIESVRVALLRVDRALLDAAPWVGALAGRRFIVLRR